MLLTVKRVEILEVKLESSHTPVSVTRCPGAGLSVGLHCAFSVLSGMLSGFPARMVPAEVSALVATSLLQLEGRPMWHGLTALLGLRALSFSFVYLILAEVEQRLLSFLLTRLRNTRSWLFHVSSLSLESAFFCVDGSDLFESLV